MPKSCVNCGGLGLPQGCELCCVEGYDTTLQELRDAAMAFTVVNQTEPFLSHPHSEALGRLGRAAEDYAEAAIRRGNR